MIVDAALVEEVLTRMQERLRREGDAAERRSTLPSDPEYSTYMNGWERGWHAGKRHAYTHAADIMSSVIAAVATTAKEGAS